MYSIYKNSIEIKYFGDGDDFMIKSAQVGADQIYL